MVKRGEKYEDESIHLLKLIYTDLVFHHEMVESIFTFFYSKEVSGVASLLHDTYNGSIIIRGFMIFI